MSFRTLQCCAAGAALAFAAAARGAPMETVVVTATRTPTPLAAIGSAVSVLDRDTIERRQYVDLTQALRHLPGVHVVQSGPMGTLSSLFTRGAGSNHTLVLLNGVELNDPSSPNGQFDLANLLLADVDRIELVRGPQSVLYGSEAIGGVLAIETLRGGPSRQGLTAEMGFHRSHRLAAHATGTLAGIDYGAAAARLDSDGTDITPARLGGGSESDGYRNATASLSVGASPAPWLELGGFVRFVDARVDTDPFLEDFDAETFSRQLVGRLEGRVTLLDGRWRTLLAASALDSRRKDVDDRQSPFGTFQRTVNEGERTTFELASHLEWLPRQVLTVGAETELEQMRARGVQDFGGFRITPLTRASRRTDALYVQQQLALGRLTASVGARLDDPEDFDSEVTFRVAPVVAIPETGSRLRASWGSGFRAPTLFDRFGVSLNSFGGAFRGNPALKPERAHGWEVGIDQALPAGASVGVTWFRTRVRGLITQVFTFPDSTSVNARDALLRGAEAYAEVPLPWWQARARLDYTWTRAEQDGGVELLRRPKHRLTLAIAATPRPGLDLDLLLRHVGSRKDLRLLTGARFTAGDYTVADLAARWAVAPGVSVFGRIENVANRRYEPATGFQAPGRTAWLGVRLTH